MKLLSKHIIKINFLFLLIAPMVNTMSVIHATELPESFKSTLEGEENNVDTELFTTETQEVNRVTTSLENSANDEVKTAESGLSAFSQSTYNNQSTNKAIQGSLTDETTQESLPDEIVPEKQTNDTNQESLSDEIVQEKQTNDVNQESLSDEIVPEKQTNDATQESLSDEIVQEKQTDVLDDAKSIKVIPTVASTIQTNSSIYNYEEFQNTHPLILDLQSSDPNRITKAFETILSAATPAQIEAIMQAPTSEALNKEIEYLLITQIEQEYFMSEFNHLLSIISPEQAEVLKNESSSEKLQALLVEIFDAVNQNFEDFELLDAIILNSSEEDIEKLFNVETDEELVIALSELYDKFLNGDSSHDSPFRFAFAAPVIWSGLASAGKALISGLGAVGAYYLNNKMDQSRTAKQTALKRTTISNAYQTKSYSSKQFKDNTIRTVINKVPSLTAHAMSFLRQAQKNVIAQARQEQQSRARTQIVSQAVSIAQDVANKLAEKRMLEKGRIQHTATNTGGGTSYYTPINATENVVVRIPTAVHSVQSGDSVYGIANKYGISTDDLINWNNIINNFIHPGETLIVRQSAPAMITSDISGIHTVATGDTLYSLALKYGTTLENLQEWNNLTTSYIFPGQPLVVKTTENGISNNHSNSTYTVKLNDSIWRIAHNFGITMDDLVKWNNITNNTIHPGDILTVREPFTTPIDLSDVADKYVVKSNDSIWRIAFDNDISMDELIEWNNIINNTIHPGDILTVSKPSIRQIEQIDTSTTYVTKAHDTVYRIANFFGVTMSELIAANDIKNNLILVGQTLTIPRTGSKNIPQSSYTHTVSMGETLWGIATKLGVTLSELTLWNNLNSTTILPGQNIVVHKQKPIIESIPIEESSPIITVTPNESQKPFVSTIPSETGNPIISVIPIPEWDVSFEIFPKISETTYLALVEEYNIPDARELTYTDTAFNHYWEKVRKGKYASESQRPYILEGANLLMNEIMKANTPQKDLYKDAALRWDVEGSFRGSKGTWELVVDLQDKKILHFLFSN